MQPKILLILSFLSISSGPHSPSPPFPRPQLNPAFSLSLSLTNGPHSPCPISFSLSLTSLPHRHCPFPLLSLFPLGHLDCRLSPSLSHAGLTHPATMVAFSDNQRRLRRLLPKPRPIPRSLSSRYRSLYLSLSLPPSRFTSFHCSPYLFLFLLFLRNTISLSFLFAVACSTLNSIGVFVDFSPWCYLRSRIRKRARK